MLRQKKNPVGGRPTRRPQTEYVLNPNKEYNYQLYARPCSTSLPEPLQRCIEELNGKQQSPEPLSKKFNLKSPSRPVTRFYDDFDPTEETTTVPIPIVNRQKSSRLFLGKKKSSFFMADKKEKYLKSEEPLSPKIKATPIITTSQWYICMSTEDRSQGQGPPVTKNRFVKNKSTFQSKSKGGLGQFSHLAKSLPSLLGPFQNSPLENKVKLTIPKIEIDKVIKGQNCDNDSSVEDESEIEELTHKFDKKSNTGQHEHRESIISKTETIYEEPWDTQGPIVDQWMNLVMERFKKNERAVDC